MSIYRKAAKRDENEPEVIDGLKWAGFTVTQLSAKGVPDLLAGRNGVNYLIEVKMPKKKLTPDQVEWHDEWLGMKPIILRSFEEAIEWANSLRRDAA